MIDLTQIIIALIGALASLITGFLIPWIKSKTTVNQQEIIRSVIFEAVRFVEQTYKSSSGTFKMQAAIEYLAERKIKVDMNQIEAAVNELFGKSSITETAEANEPAQTTFNDEDVRGEVENDVEL